MGVLVGFVIGYVLGAKAGPDSLEQLRKAWDEIRASEEFKAMAQSAAAMADQVVQRATEEGKGPWADRLRSALAGESRDALKRRLRAVQ